MSLTADVKAVYFAPSTRNATTIYPMPTPTGPCWFRGAHVAFNLDQTGTGPEVTDVLLKFHDGDEDPFLVVGCGSWNPIGILVGAEECYMDATSTGIRVSCTNAVYISKIMLTVFYS